MFQTSTLCIYLVICFVKSNATLENNKRLVLTIGTNFVLQWQYSFAGNVKFFSAINVYTFSPIFNNLIMFTPNTEYYSLFV